MRETRGVIIDSALAKRLKEGWVKELLTNGDVLNRMGAFLIKGKDVENTLSSEGEIEFRRWKGDSEKFVKTLEQSADMPGDNRGMLKSRQERIKDFETRNQTISCENHGKIKCEYCPVP